MSGPDASSRLRGLSILLVEDSYFVAVAMAKQLRELGCRVVGPVPTVASAIGLLSHERCDAAVLDINLGGETAEAIADALEARRVPFVFVTGYSNPTLLGPHYENHARIVKPVTPESLREALAAAVAA